MRNSNNKNKALTGLIWSFVDLFSRHGISLVIQIILARILLPSDFGLIGMTMIFISLSHAFVNSGFDQALIREKNINNRELSTIFYFNISISIIIYISVYFIAPYIGEYFNEDRVIDVIRILMIIVVINAFTIVQRVILVRNLNFKLQTRVSVISSIISGVIAIVLAINGAGVWSLVIQQLIMQFLISILLILSVRWIPSLYFSLEIFKRYFKFGYKLLVGGFIDTLNQNLPNIIIGRLFGVAQLGYYTKARNISDIVSGTMAQATQRVTYPVLSRYKENYIEMSKKHVDLLVMIMLIYFPIIIFLFNTAALTIPFVFGKQWEASVDIFQILLIHAILYPVISLNLAIFKVINRTDIFLKSNLLSLLIVTFTLIMVIFINPNIYLIILFFSIHQLIFYILITLILGKVINYNYIYEWKKLLKVFSPSFLLLIVGYMTNKFLVEDDLTLFIIHIFISVALVTIGTIILCKKEIKILFEFIKGAEKY